MHIIPIGKSSGKIYHQELLYGPSFHETWLPFQVVPCITSALNAVATAINKHSIDLPVTHVQYISIITERTNPIALP